MEQKAMQAYKHGGKLTFFASENNNWLQPYYD